MVLLFSRKNKIKLLIVGVNSYSDTYPNIKYKISILRETFKDQTSLCFIDTKEKSGYLGLSSSPVFKSIKLCFIHLFCSVRASVSVYRTNPENIYITYPSLLILLTLRFTLLFCRVKPKIHVDFFISLYDTIVVDRALLSRQSILAKALFFLEKKSLLSAEKILCDTQLNCEYYSKLYNLNSNKFIEMPLTIPNLAGYEVKPKVEDQTDVFKVVFFGSLVPLHGVDIIVEAAKLLVNCNKKIEIHIFGDGQASQSLEDAIESGLKTLVWHKGFYETEELYNEIAKANVCLGVFSGSAKSERVLPYKLYYYMAIGKAFITANSAQMQIMQKHENYHEAFASLIKSNSPKCLADKIKEFEGNRELLTPLGASAKIFFRDSLSNELIKKQLFNLFI